MIDLSFDALWIYLFYALGAICLYTSLFITTSGKQLKSWVVAVTVVLVSSEFWEIPIFAMAYAGAPGFSSPNIYNHLIVIVMAVVLLAFSSFHLDFLNGSAIIGILLFNTAALIIFPGVLNAWIPRSLSLCGLSWIFWREVYRNG